MPDRYELQAPDGFTIEVESDHLPTPADALQAIRAYGDQQAAAAQAKAEQRAHAPFRALATSALNALPGVGAIVGGIMSTPETGGMGTLPGVALGAGAGRGLRDLVTEATGLEPPTTPRSKAMRIGVDSAVTAAIPGAIETLKTPLRSLGEMLDIYTPPALKRLLPAWEKIRPPTAPATSVLERPAWQTWPEYSRIDETGPVSSRPPGTPMIRIGGQSIDPASPLGQQLRPFITAPPRSGGPLAVAPLTAAEAPPMPNTAEVPVLRPLDPSRAMIGAEKTGRPLGLSKEQVRAMTTPVLGEAQGAASEIMPRNAMDRIVDRLIEMGPKGTGGPESARDAYVLAANSEKARTQVKAYLDALRKVGFAVPVAMGARQVLTGQMRNSIPTGE